MNADVFPVVARHGDVVTFGTEAEKSDKRKYVFVFKITNGVVCVSPPPLPSPPIGEGEGVAVHKLHWRKKLGRNNYFSASYGKSTDILD